MTIGCNIWMICLILIWFFYGLRRMFQLPQFVWALRSSVWDVFINFLLIDATDRSKIRNNQKRFIIALSLYPLSFFANTPFKIITISNNFVGHINRVDTCDVRIQLYWECTRIYLVFLIPWNNINHDMRCFPVN